MSKVYVVTSGSCSEYKIEAVFLTLPAAEAYTAAHNNANPFSECHIDEYESNDDAITPADVIWGVFVTKGVRGNVFLSEPTPVLTVPPDTHRQDHGGDYHRIFVPTAREHSVTDESRAIKVAYDRITQWKAEQAGISE